MIQEIYEYKNILNSLAELIGKSPLKKGFIIEKIGITAPTFYRKIKLLSFTPDEVLKIVRIVNPEESYLYDLKESIKRGKQDYKDGKTHDRSEVIEEIKNLLA